MADETDSGEKTEKPTGRRLSEARREGQVGVSTDLSSVLGLIAAFIALQHAAPALWHDLMLITRGSFQSRYGEHALNADLLRAQTVGVMQIILPEVLLIMLAASFFGAGCTLIQTKFLWSWHLIRPRMMHINPMAGISRIFSSSNFVNLTKSIFKLAIISPIAYFAFFKYLDEFIGLLTEDITHLIPFTAEVMSAVFWKMVLWLLLLAIIDLIYQKWTVMKKLMMTKQEIKDERKAIEGDETVRRKILMIGMQRVRQRMLAAVKTADVVVTNPTHFAVALSYSLDPGSAPRVVAKGRGYLAQRIKEIAREHGVPVIERKSLARALFKMAEVGDEIPYELYRAVAEVLAYVYRLKGRVPGKAKDAMNKKRER